MNYFLNFFNRLRPERFFLVAGFISGILILFITPPFHVPDEPNHFYRAWQIADGGFISVKQDKRVGGSLPASLENQTSHFARFIWSKEAKMEEMDISGHLKIPLHPGETKFYDFNNTALYSPLCYAPASLALYISRLLNTSPLYAFYFARLLTFLFWLLAIYYCIKMVPVYKWLFTFLALLPMSLFINVTISADVVTNAACFLFITYALKCAADGKPIDRARVIRLLSLIFLLACVKFVYASLVLVLLIIPRNKFASTTDYYKKLGLLFFSAFIFTLFWYTLLNPLYLSYENYHPGYRDSAALVNGADAQKQLAFIFAHGSYIFSVFIKSFELAFEMYFRGYIGTFGWLDTSMPWWFVICSYLFILFLSFADSNKGIFIDWKQKLIIGFTFLTALLLLLLSQHLIWDPVGGEAILNIQGRYLIPFIPLAFMLFYTPRFPFKQIIAPLSIVTIVLSLVYTVQLIYFRYF